MAKKSNTTAELSDLLEAAVLGIKQRGGAELGDKTMVDVWEVVVPEYAAGQLTSEKITQAVEATKDLVAKRGRASYLGERSVGQEASTYPTSSAVLIEDWVALSALKEIS